MLIPLTPTQVVDACQVARLQASGPAQTIVTPYYGAPFVVALALAAVAALVNGTPDGTLLALFTTTQGAQWLGGQNATALAQVGANVRVQLGEAQAVITGQTVAAVGAVLNALARCGGAPPPPPVFLDAAPFTPTVTNLGGNTFAQNGPCTLTRAGGTSGNIATGTVRVYGTVLAGTFASFEIGGLPNIPNAGFQCVASARVISGSPLPIDGFLVNRNNATSFSVQGGPFVLETVLMIDLDFGYTL